MKFTFEAKDLNRFSFLDVRITLSLLLQLFSKPHLVEFLQGSFSSRTSASTFQNLLHCGKFSDRNITAEKYLQV